MDTDYICPCEDLRRWRATHGERTGWNALPRAAQYLSRYKGENWEITPAKKLLDSAKRGCGTCLLLSRAIGTLRPPDLIVSTVKLSLSNRIDQLKVSVTFLEDGAEATQSFYLYHPEGYVGYKPFGPNSLRAPEQPRPEPLAYNVDQTIHTLCRTRFPSGDGRYAPTRLLCVNLRRRQQGLNKAEDSVRLIETWPRFSSAYVALSHCWGQRGHVTTTKANYASRKSGIPIHELSRTFQDAVWVTRKIGIAYIWIDSLCIIQDDPQDWEREAANMYRLYWTASLTLAASHGADGNAGLFPLAADGQITKLDVNMPGLTGDETTVSVTVMAVPRLDKKSQVHRAYGTDDDSFSEADVLQTRGWVLQERVLSAAVAHFNAQELVCEWKGRIMCDCGIISRRSTMTEMMRSPGDGYRFHNRVSSSSSDGDDDNSNDDSSDYDGNLTAVLDPDESYNLWARFVHAFTTRGLTKPNDRSAAFSGIAQIFQMLLKHDDDDGPCRDLGDYYAGLWQDSFPEALRWSCSTNDLFSLQQQERQVFGAGGSARIPDARAPSWSWCSVSGPCNVKVNCPEQMDMYLERTNTSCESPRFAYESATGSPFGQLRKASLTFDRVELCKATRSSAHESFTLLSREGRRLGSASEINVSFDDQEETEAAQDIFLFLIWHGSHEWRIDRPCHPPEHLEGGALQEWYYKVWEPQIMGSSRCKDHTFGVVLALDKPGTKRKEAAATSTGGSRYRRLGIFHMRGPFCANMEVDRHGEWWSKDEKLAESDYAQEVTESLRLEDAVTLV